MLAHLPIRDELSAVLAAFLDSAVRLWRVYLDLGPGQLELDRYDEVANCHQALAECLDRAAVLDVPLGDDRDLCGRIRNAADEARALAERCVRLPQGLCFVSGEAGLVPRADQHRAMETWLELLDESLQALTT